MLQTCLLKPECYATKSVCLEVNPIMVNNFADLFNCMSMDQALDSFNGIDIRLFILVGWSQILFVCCLVHRGSTDDFYCIRISAVLFDTPGLSMYRNTLYLLNLRLCFIILLYHYLFVYYDFVF